MLSTYRKIEYRMIGAGVLEYWSIGVLDFFMADRRCQWGLGCDKQLQSFRVQCSRFRVVFLHLHLQEPFLKNLVFIK